MKLLTPNKQLFFSYPHHPCIDQWFDICGELFTRNTLPTHFGHEVYSIFNTLNYQNISIKTSQAVLVTPEEKSIYRLGLATAKNAHLDQGILTEASFATLHNALLCFEESDAISGFFQNMLISGKKPMD